MSMDLECDLDLPVLGLIWYDVPDTALSTLGVLGYTNIVASYNGGPEEFPIGYSLELLQIVISW